MSKYLIINADDYGMSQSANEAVEDLFERGSITSTTLMTPCPWAEDALARAKKNPKMHVGLHTTLNAEWEGFRWGPVSRSPVPSLLDSGGYFYNNVPQLLAACDPADVETELNAQLDWMLSRGYNPTHIDNHMGSLYGVEGKALLQQAFKLCLRGGYAFRLPRSTAMFGQVPPEAEPMLAQAVAAADAMGIGTLDNLTSNHRPLTDADTYDTLKAIYLDLIARMPDGITEIYMHPAAQSNELIRMTPHWRARVFEYRLLLDPDLPAAIEAAGAKLTTWIDAPFACKKKA